MLLSQHPVIHGCIKGSAKEAYGLIQTAVVTDASMHAVVGSDKKPGKEEGLDYNVQDAD